MFACYRALARGRYGRGCKSRARDRDGRARGCGHGHDGRARSFGGCLLLLGRFVGCCNRRQQALALWALALLVRRARDCSYCDCGYVAAWCCCMKLLLYHAHARTPIAHLLLWRLVRCCERVRCMRKATGC